MPRRSQQPPRLGYRDASRPPAGDFGKPADAPGAAPSLPACAGSEHPLGARSSSAPSASTNDCSSAGRGRRSCRRSSPAGSHHTGTGGSRGVAPSIAGGLDPKRKTSDTPLAWCASSGPPVAGSGCLPRRNAAPATDSSSLLPILPWPPPARAPGARMMLPAPTAYAADRQIPALLDRRPHTHQEQGGLERRP